MVTMSPTTASKTNLDLTRDSGIPATRVFAAAASSTTEGKVPGQATERVAGPATESEALKHQSTPALTNFITDDNPLANPSGTPGLNIAQTPHPDVVIRKSSSFGPPGSPFVFPWRRSVFNWRLTNGDESPFSSLGTSVANGRTHLQHDIHVNEEPEDAVAVANPSNNANSSKRNTNQEAKKKGQRIRTEGAGGVPHKNGNCLGCPYNECIVNPAVSGGNTCVKCAEQKEKCSHQVREDGEEVKRKGDSVAQPCDRCAGKIKAGLPADCRQAQAGSVLAKKVGTACSECMVDGNYKKCSVKERRTIEKKVKT
ncbi:hypothetical protein V8F20_003961 [Naviculisporaceae sp. PSN 640]